jgi:hypothetical protein
MEEKQQQQGQNQNTNKAASQEKENVQQQQQLSNPISRKLNKILESRIENDKVGELIGFYWILNRLNFVS